MTSVVRFRASSASAACTRRSLTASRCEVASSRISTGASFRKAPAMATRWPGRRRAGPRARHDGVEPLGQGRDHLGKRGPRHRVGQLARRGVGARDQDVLAKRRVEQVRVLATSAMRRRSSSSRYSGSAWPSSDTVPAAGSQKRRHRFATVVFPAPDEPTRATVEPASTRNDTSISAGRGRPGYAKVTARSSRAGAGRRVGPGAAPTPGPSVTVTGSACTAYTRRVAASVSASWRPTCAISQIGTKAEHGEQGQQRQPAGVERASGGQDGAGGDHREAAEPGGRLLAGRLAREVAQERQAGAGVLAGPGLEGGAPRPLLLEGDQLGQSLHRAHGVGAEHAQAWRARDARRSIRPRASTGESPAYARNGASAAATSQPWPASVAMTTVGTSTATAAGVTVCAKKYSMNSMSCVAVVARSPERRCTKRRPEPVELPEEVDPHVGEQTIGEVVGEPRLEPVEEPGERRHDEQRGEPESPRLARLDGLHHERRQDPDPDQRRHPGQPEPEGHREPGPEAAHQAEQDADDASPAQVLRRADLARRDPAVLPTARVPVALARGASREAGDPIPTGEGPGRLAHISS